MHKELASTSKSKGIKVSGIHLSVIEGDKNSASNSWLNNGEVIIYQGTDLVVIDFKGYVDSQKSIRFRKNAGRFICNEKTSFPEITSLEELKNSMYQYIKKSLQDHSKMQKFSPKLFNIELNFRITASEQAAIGKLKLPGSYTSTHNNLIAKIIPKNVNLNNNITYYVIEYTSYFTDLAQQEANLAIISTHNLVNKEKTDFSRPQAMSFFPTPVSSFNTNEHPKGFHVSFTVHAYYFQKEQAAKTLASAINDAIAKGKLSECFVKAKDRTHSNFEWWVVELNDAQLEYTNSKFPEYLPKEENNVNLSCK